MTNANHRDVLVDMAERLEPIPVGAPRLRDSRIADAARNWAHAITWLPGTKQSDHFAQRWTSLMRRLELILSEVDFTLAPREQLPEDLQWMHDNVRLVRATQSEVQQSVSSLRRVPHVRTPDKIVMPRVVAMAQDFLSAVE